MSNRSATDNRPAADRGAPGGKSKQEAAYGLIRERIRYGQYTPGQRLIIDQLAHEFGVSQVPVREAIRRLEAEGWVKYELNMGATVTPLDVETWSQLTEAVALMEGYATALAAPHLSNAHLEQLATINRQMRQALRQLDVQHVSENNRAFHRLILERCPNAIIAGQLRQSQARLDGINRALFSREEGVFLHLLGPDMGQTAVSDHQNLIKAIRQRSDIATIERLTREHVLVHLRAARAELMRREAGSPSRTGVGRGR